jgi:flagellar hook-associated protein 1
MSGLFGLMHVSKMTLMAQEATLGVINHNIANANTPGYSRQRINLESRMSVGSSVWAIGGGVEISGVQRMSNEFLLGQMGRADRQFGEQSSMMKNLSIMENIFGEPVDDVLGETSLGDSISEFLSSWQPALNPEMESDSADIRGLIIEAARVMSYRFNSVATDLVSLGDSLKSELQGTVAAANEMMNQVANLNREIMTSTISDSYRADLLDARQQILRDLSSQIGAEWEIDQDMQLKVYIGGRAIVDHTAVHELGVEFEGVAESRTLRAAVYPKDDNLPITAFGGKLKGQLAMLNQEIPETLRNLDNLAARIIDRVNELHQQAVGDGGGGVSLFTGDNASSIAVSTVVINSPETVSLMGIIADGRDIASAMFDMHSEGMNDATGVTVEGFYAKMVGDLGAKSRSAQQLTQTTDRLLAGLEDQYQSEAGVNVDEELTNMMVAQTTYQAASRVIAMVDEMMDALVNMI